MCTYFAFIDRLSFISPPPPLSLSLSLCLGRVCSVYCVSHWWFEVTLECCPLSPLSPLSPFSSLSPPLLSQWVSGGLHAQYTPLLPCSLCCLANWSMARGGEVKLHRVDEWHEEIEMDQETLISDTLECLVFTLSESPYPTPLLSYIPITSSPHPSFFTLPLIPLPIPPSFYSLSFLSLSLLSTLSPHPSFSLLSLIPLPIPPSFCSLIPLSPRRSRTSLLTLCPLSFPSFPFLPLPSFPSPLLSLLSQFETDGH